MHDRNDADTRGTAGLLAVAQAQVGGGSASGSVDAGDYVFTYDANGNVAQVLDLSAGSAAAAIVAHYEYDPYGGVVNNLSGYTYAEANPIRFSTKYWDAETGLGYWGYRYYSARLGRWLSRDPIGEAGGAHLYAYVFNQPTVSHDALGLCKIGDACHNVEYTIQPDELKPGRETAIVVALAAVEVVGTVTRVRGGVRSYGASECVPSRSPGMFTLTVDVARFFVLLKDLGYASVWTRHKCSKCRQNTWNRVWSSLNLCEPQGHWKEGDWSDWHRCTVPILGEYPPPRLGPLLDTKEKWQNYARSGFITVEPQ